MKIQLERKLASCPKKLVCTVCQQQFESGNIRALLYNNQRLLQGDICSDCLQLPAVKIQENLRSRATLLLEQPATIDAYNYSSHDRALELFQAAQEDLKFPNFFEWWLKKLEILSEESQELEADRMGLTEYYLAERSRLQRMLEDDRD